MSDKPKFRPVNDPISPQTVGNPDAAADLSIDQEHMEELVSSGSEGEAGDVVCQKPPKGIFFTVRAEQGKPWHDRAFYWFLEIDGRDPYIVHPSIAEQKKDEEDTIRPVLIVRYVTMAGDEALWALKLDPPDGRSNSYNRSALNILALAEGGGENGTGTPIWIRLLGASRGQQKNKHYRYQKSKKTLEQVPPKFTKRTFKELVIGICFKDRVIDSLDHEVWEILAHGSTK
jgi:hypothetical protein